MQINVSDEKNKIILTRVYPPEGRIAFTSETPGEYTLCFKSNYTSASEVLQVRVHVNILVGGYSKDYENIAQKEYLNKLEIRILRLMDNAEQIEKEQFYQRQRIVYFKKQNENLRSFTFWILLTQSTLLILSAFWLTHKKRKLETFISDENIKELLEPFLEK